jgi:hypothetical protein
MERRFFVHEEVVDGEVAHKRDENHDSKADSVVKHSHFGVLVQVFNGSLRKESINVGVGKNNTIPELSRGSICQTLNMHLDWMNWHDHWRVQILQSVNWTRIIFNFEQSTGKSVKKINTYVIDWTILKMKYDGLKKFKLETKFPHNRSEGMTHRTNGGTDLQVHKQRKLLARKARQFANRAQMEVEHDVCGNGLLESRSDAGSTGIEGSGKGGADPVPAETHEETAHPDAGNGLGVFPQEHPLDGIRGQPENGLWVLGTAQSR